MSRKCILDKLNKLDVKLSLPLGGRRPKMLTFNFLLYKTPTKNKVKHEKLQKNWQRPTSQLCFLPKNSKKVTKNLNKYYVNKLCSITFHEKVSSNPNFSKNSPKSKKNFPFHEKQRKWKTAWNHFLHIENGWTKANKYFNILQDFI